MLLESLTIPFQSSFQVCNHYHPGDTIQSTVLSPMVIVENFDIIAVKSG